MAASNRLKKELLDIKKISDNRPYQDVNAIDDSNMLVWKALIMPDKAPYDKGAFKIQIVYPPEYPFKPPKITFMTKIYHPNIDEKGQVCLPIISAENWKPATKTEQVINSLVELISSPEPEHPLRADVAEEYTRDRKKFNKKAEEFVQKFGEKRPEPASRK